MDIEKYLKSGKLEQYVLGLASPQERKEIEQLAKESPEIDAYICDLHNCMNSCSKSNEVPISNEPKQKSTCKTFQLKSRNNLVAERKNISTYQNLYSISWSTGIASFFVIGMSTLSFFLYQSQQSTKTELALLSTQLHHLEIENQSLGEGNGKILQQYAVLKDVNTRHVNLRGLNNAPQAHGVVYWNEAHGKSYLSICNLPETPEGHLFCVWADVNGKQQKVGELNLKSADVLHNLSFVKGCSGFCVTLEKEGANSQPNIDKMLVSGEM